MVEDVHPAPLNQVSPWLNTAAHVIAGAHVSQPSAPPCYLSLDSPVHIPPEVWVWFYRQRSSLDLTCGEQGGRIPYMCLQLKLLLVPMYVASASLAVPVWLMLSLSAPNILESVILRLCNWLLLYKHSILHGFLLNYLFPTHNSFRQSRSFISGPLLNIKSALSSFLACRSSTHVLSVFIWSSVKLLNGAHSLLKGCQSEHPR